MNRFHLIVLLSGALLPAQTTDRIAILEGSAANDLRVRVVDERNPSGAGTVALTNVEILPIEITCRTAQMSFVPGRARLAERQGLRAVELPAGGRLLRYRRGGGTDYGFLWIDASGAATVVHELAGGAGGTDPYEDRIAIAPDGRHASVTTKLGDIFVIRLDGKDYASTNAPARRLALPAGSVPVYLAVAVGPTHLFFVTGDVRVWRCAVADGNQPIDVTPPGAPGHRLKDALAPSGDGTAVVFLFGPKDLYTIYLLRSTGAAVALPPPAAKYEEPGYLPDVVGGPRLLLNEDATRLMYIDGTVRDEIYVLDTTGRTGTTHITSDANFQPYIGVGILPAFAAAELTLAVGDPQKFDWFQATTASRTVVNLTRTGPRANPPFDTGTLVPTFGFPTGDGRMVTTETAGGNVSVRLLDPKNTSSTVLMQSVRETPEMGAALQGGAPTVLLPGNLGDAFLRLDPFGTALVGPPGVELSAEVAGPGGLFSVFTAKPLGAPSPVLPVFRMKSGSIYVLSPVAGLRQLVLTRAGGALFNGNALQYASQNGTVTMTGSPAIRVVLSGYSQ